MSVKADSLDIFEIFGDIYVMLINISPRLPTTEKWLTKLAVFGLDSFTPLNTAQTYTESQLEDLLNITLE